jgi:hypothetical protein
MQYVVLHGLGYGAVYFAKLVFKSDCVFTELSLKS